MTTVVLTAKVLITDVLTPGVLIAVVDIAGVLNARVLMVECYSVGDL